MDHGIDRSTIQPFLDGEPGRFYYAPATTTRPASRRSRRSGSSRAGTRSCSPRARPRRPRRRLGCYRQVRRWLHSATKYLGGQHDVLLGALVFRDAETHARVTRLRGLTGAVAGPDAAWLLLRGLKTLRVRVERQSATALELARRLADHPAVERVRYPGLGDPVGRPLNPG